MSISNKSKSIKNVKSSSQLPYFAPHQVSSRLKPQHQLKNDHQQMNSFSSDEFASTINNLEDSSSTSEFLSSAPGPSESIFQLQKESPIPQNFWIKPKKNSVKIVINSLKSNQRKPSKNDSPDDELNDDPFSIAQPKNSIPVVGLDNSNNPPPFMITLKQQQNIQAKLEEKQARKLQTRNIIEVPTNSDKKSTDNKPSQLSPVVHSKLEIPHRKITNDQMVSGNHAIPIHYPAGVPKQFVINQGHFGAIEPQRGNRPRIFANPASANPPTADLVASTNTGQNVSAQHANDNVGERQVYSPTGLYESFKRNEDDLEDFESLEDYEPAEKRQSAFDRLGPVAQAKKPKLTINLSLSKDQSVREVVETEPVPIYEDERILNSTDETVAKHRDAWPWKNHVVTKKTVTLRPSKTVMMMEQEKMEEIYDKDTAFVMITVTGYPPTWKKEDLLDLMLENLSGKSFVPCFIDFTPKECRFFVLRVRSALLAIHWMGFVMRKDDVELVLSISTTTISSNRLNFIPRMVLKRRLAMNYDGETKLDLSNFTLEYDVSHFIYFPLKRVSNQDELVRIQSDIYWEYLTELNLSHNNITSLEGFKLEETTPKLKTLDLSYNLIQNIKPLMQCRKLTLKKLFLEGNPLCTDYTDPDRYVKVMRTLYPTLRELDGVPIVLKGEVPPYLKNYCPEGAKAVVEKFLEVYFPLLEQPPDDRDYMFSLYAEKAVMTITYRNRIRYEHKYKDAWNVLMKGRVLLEGKGGEVCGGEAIVKLLGRWPSLQHDPSTFTVDVMLHSVSVQ
ncbi:uncharacterized protein LOC112049052 isoform X2 [Bicyclus anynana]|uniref:Uncharacterized protein LOC112049052 isoform X2 n=1 Tax=Bicyclus anynana TaxID=110368 RepID=A0ABM3LSQ0_BICAN|nr:uncharacterized protein LOC112049052 isoform X2 [Bicyclus anynana]